MSALTTSESVRPTGHHLRQVSGVCSRQGDRPQAAPLLSIKPNIIIIIINVVSYYGIDAISEMLQCKMN